MDAAVVWMADADARAPGAEAARRALDDWARAHGARLVAPLDAGAPRVSVDLAVGDGVEAELERARDALAALDVDTTERALARAESSLRSHPELPDAPWLMAEVQRGWAARWLRGAAGDARVDVGRATRAWQAAAALDGGRVAGAFERDLGGAPPDVSASLVVDLDDGAEARLDGRPVAPGAIRCAPGVHQITITGSGGQLAWAEWVAIDAGVRVEIAPPRAAACSRGDFAGVTVVGSGDGERVRADAVRCASWVAAVTSSRTSSSDGEAVRVATCSGARCGPLIEWRTRFRGVAPAASPAAAERHWPAWATWSLVGVGAVVAGTAAVLASGALRAPSTEVRFVNGGVKPAGASFAF